MSGSTLNKMPHCLKSHVIAHIRKHQTWDYYSHGGILKLYYVLLCVTLCPF